MSFVIIRGERLALELGQTILGGRGEGALLCDAIAGHRPFAVIDYPLDGPSTIMALEPGDVQLNGAPLSQSPQVLAHGDRIGMGALQIAFGDIHTAGRTNDAAPITDEQLTIGTMGQSIPTDSTGGRLTRLGGTSTHGIPAHGITIGRDPDSNIVLTSKDASRRHASITPSLLGYTITDESSNGVWINGVRLDGAQVLSRGDTIRIAGDEFRFDADEASFAPAFAVDEAPVSAATAVPLPQPRAATTLLATLEVLTDGESKGTRFRIERVTVQLGRSRENDITLANESVSGTHASLVLRGYTWHVVDLGSRNGTYVEGEIVKEQRVLPNVCELRLGSLVLLFRAISTAPPDVKGTVGVIGLTDEQIRKG